MSAGVVLGMVSPWFGCLRQLLCGRVRTGRCRSRHSTDASTSTALGENKTNCVQDLPRSRRLCAEAPFAERPFEARCGPTAVLHHISVDERGCGTEDREGETPERGFVATSCGRVGALRRQQGTRALMEANVGNGTPRTRRSDRSGYSMLAGPLDSD